MLHLFVAASHGRQPRNFFGYPILLFIQAKRRPSDRRLLQRVRGGGSGFVQLGRPRCSFAIYLGSHVMDIQRVLFYVIGYYTILFYSILFHSILFYSILFYHIILYYIILYTLSRHVFP